MSGPSRTSVKAEGMARLKAVMVLDTLATLRWLSMLARRSCGVWARAHAGPGGDPDSTSDGDAASAANGDTPDPVPAASVAVAVPGADGGRGGLRASHRTMAKYSLWVGCGAAG